jgi:hypothetical protein
MSKASRRAERKKLRGNYEGWVRVASEFGSYGLWELEVPCQKTYGKAIGYDHLKLPPELAARFQAWCDKFERSNPWKKDDFDYAGHGQEGLQLAKKLKAFLGPTWYVECGFGEAIE